MDLRFQYFIIITSVYGGIWLGFQCFPTYILSNSSLNIELGWCLHFGWMSNLPGEGDRSQHSGSCLGMLMSVSSGRDFGHSGGSPLPPILVAGLQTVLTLFDTNFLAMF